MAKRFSWRLLKKQIDKAQVLVFDLDDTLYLHNGCYDDYHNDIKDFLEELSKRNKVLCIATHNGAPNKLLERIKIKHLFEYIIFETKDLNPYLNSVLDYTNKKDMIREIMEKTKCGIKDIIFFDDNIYNIVQVESLNVRCVFVPDKGLDLMLLR
jgi:HAD superfamily phosphatase (TIGR01681 family)